MFRLLTQLESDLSYRRSVGKYYARIINTITLYALVYKLLAQIDTLFLTLRVRSNLLHWNTVIFQEILLYKYFSIKYVLIMGLWIFFHQDMKENSHRKKKKGIVIFYFQMFYHISGYIRTNHLLIEYFMRGELFFHRWKKKLIYDTLQISYIFPFFLN